MSDQSNETAGVETLPAVISIAGGDALPATVAIVEGETVVPDAIEAVEGTGAETNAVEIAQIEADTAVTIAAINADVETTRIEAHAVSSAEAAELRERNTWLESQLANMTEQTREMEARLSTFSTPPVSQETAEELTEATEVLAEALDPETLTDTSETTPETSSSTPTEAPSESEAGSREERDALLRERNPLKRALRFL